MSARPIALATYAALPQLASDDQLLLEALGTLGARAEPAVWDDVHVVWGAFATVVIRSCWDYHLRLDEFLAWVDRLDRDGVRVWNPPAVLRWNARKTYLRDLEASGVRTVPTLWIGTGIEGDGAAAAADIPSLASVMAHAGWDEVVVKPAVSASAHETWRVTRGEAHAAEHDARIRALAVHGVMLQPYVREVERDGEWSFMFFGDRFSHAVIKQAAPGDFRVQREYGGTHRAVPPPTHLIAQAQAALRAAPAPTLYARVDGVVVGGDLVIGELELLEPSLFLDADPRAPERLARLIVERIDA